jgi:hypothetical protein
MSNRVTRGDAEAVLHAGAAGVVVKGHGGVVRGAPADNEVRAAIRPYPGTIWDGHHFCAEDWHLLAAAWFVDFNESRTIQQAKDELAATTIQLVLDGTELATERTAIRRMPEQPEGSEEAEGFYFQQGIIVAPGDLSVGSHTFAFTVMFPGGSEDGQSTFIIDSPGTGACL